MDKSIFRPVTCDNARLGAYTTMAKYKQVSSIKHIAANIRTALLSNRLSRYLYRKNKLSF